jgi:hypothetical protein
MPELKRLTNQDLDRMQEIQVADLPEPNIVGITGFAKNLSHAVLGPEWDEDTENWDRIGNYLPAGLDMFLLNMPVTAVPYTVLNADWKGIANSKNTVDAVGRFLDTGMPGILDFTGLSSIGALDYVLPIGAGAAAQVADYKMKHPGPPDISIKLPPIKQTKLKPSDDILWETYKP